MIKILFFKPNLLKLIKNPEAEMNQDPLIIYKLIILYMLNRVVFPLTKAQVCDFVLEKEYTNFINLQQAISELIDRDLISSKSIRNRTHLELTEDGKQTLNFFENRLSQAIKDDINTYFKEKEFELRNEISIYSDYYKATNGEYEASLVFKEKELELVNIKLSIPTKEMAVSICDKWEGASQDIYKYLVSKLF